MVSQLLLWIVVVKYGDFGQFEPVVVFAKLELGGSLGFFYARRFEDERSGSLLRAAARDVGVADLHHLVQGFSGSVHGSFHLSVLEV